MPHPPCSIHALGPADIAPMRAMLVMFGEAFDEVDTYTSLAKQFAMLRLILEYQEKGNQALDAGANLSDVIALPVREQIGRAKYIPESEMKRFEQIESDLSSQCAALMDEGGEG